MKKKKTIWEICDNPNFIEGIYNYCDRWCERCAFTSRCANFAIGKERFGDDKDADISNAEFWKELAEILKESLEMLEEKAQEFGIDLNEALDEIKLPPFDETKKHFLVQLSMQYAQKVDEWLDQPIYADQETARFIESKKVEMADAVEVIRWYQYQIDVKFRRALTTFVDDDDYEDINTKERNGSAKVSLIGIDRSLSAWNVLWQLIEDRQKSIIEIIALLNKIKSIAEKQFPDARNFIRPGLDE